MWPPGQFHEPILQRRGQELDVAPPLEGVGIRLAIGAIGSVRPGSDPDRRERRQG
jgi:hypothetical protein